jgi:hypothetical protein
MDELGIRVVPTPWNKGKLVGQKAPLKLKEIWAIRVRLQVYRRAHELALFDLGIDSKLRACELLKSKVETSVTAGGSLFVRSTRAVRDHGVDTNRFNGLDQAGGSRV